MLRLELQKSFQHVEGGMQDPDPNYIGALEVPRNFMGR